MTNKEQDVVIKQLVERVDLLTEFLQRIINQMQQQNTIFHLHLLETGHAKKAHCTNCNTEVVYPILPGLEAYPVCPNATEENEDCLKGFDHIRPKGEQRSIEDWDGGKYTVDEEE